MNHYAALINAYQDTHVNSKPTMKLNLALTCSAGSALAVKARHPCMLLAGIQHLSAKTPKTFLSKAP
ncbi:hypothetical protein RS130_16410 [Paraglaciecola aquimarina]|uniref:Uncharacterized protein n=1 Tax=Paraglaciecola aquimarina TaxID=1235557 RepID=A0ABU3SZ49_9ALTE|nr:hypothetical protein [Paraglaciecola aquimarina]MDU0355278.1 hypothetical protein [Paraglaciecola aquimarina]